MNNEKKYDVVKQDKWECPADTGVPLLTMPNVPKPLHGLPPRVIMGKSTWDHVRKRCYFEAGYKCEICGCEPPKGQLHAHELYSYDWKAGTGKFERCIAICKQDHDFIHSGRLITMLKNNNILYPKEYVLGVVEKGFKLVYEYNTTHRNKKPLRVYSTFLNYLEVPSIHDEMEKLIDKYEIQFYEDPDEQAEWGDWKLLIGDVAHPTPYANYWEWKDAMNERSKFDTARIAGQSDPFSGGSFDVAKALLDSIRKKS